MSNPNAKTYPKATQVAFGHVPREDRLALDLTLQAPTGAELRRAWLTRRMVAAMLVKLSEVIGQSHPVAGRTPDPDEVLQMEHLAAVAGTGAVGDRA